MGAEPGRVGAVPAGPGPLQANRHFAEIIRFMPDSDEELCWWWSWGERICPAGDIELARRIIASVVTPTAGPADGR